MHGYVGNDAAGPSTVDRHGVSIEAKRQAALQRLQQSQARRRQRELDAQQSPLRHKAASVPGVCVTLTFHRSLSSASLASSLTSLGVLPTCR